MPMSATPFATNLNDKQQEAVTTSHQNTLVLAGAGSGKTRVLVSRIAFLIDTQQIPASAILAVTFTNKAAKEMTLRLSKLINRTTDGLWVGTFHGLCHRLLRLHHDAAGLPLGFQILDSDDEARLLKRIMNELNINTEQWPIKNVLSFINRQKDEGLRAEQIQLNEKNKMLLHIYKQYEQIAQASGVIGFSEILLRAYELLRDNPNILSLYHNRFQAILVDEIQDTNTIQYQWLRLLTGPSAYFMAVGDDDQSIYGWRGAKIENIARIQHDFKNIHLIRLEQNYRSTARILEAANALIQNNVRRLGKNLWTQGLPGSKINLYKAINEIDEAAHVANTIENAINKGISPHDIAILYRSNAQSRTVEDALIHRNIHYTIHGGLRFFERAEIKDIISYLRLISNPQDNIAFERILNVPTRGIGEKTRDLLKQMASTEGCSLWEAIPLILEKNELNARAHNALRGFSDLILQLKQDIENQSLAVQIETVIYNSGLHALFTSIKSDRTTSAIDNLQEMINAAKEFQYDLYEDDQNMTPLQAFLAHTALNAGEDNAPSAEKVHLMTLHAAKGLEFSHVFIVGMEEGLFPSQQSFEDIKKLEEERRLCYVGMTRAMHHLTLSYAQIRRLYGREEYHKPSRFLHEIPQELLDNIKKLSPKRPTYISAELSEQPHATMGLGARVIHKTFGEGIILAFEGQGARQRVQINFKKDGIKWLVLAYAQLSACID